jgi:hypothetical protein
MVMVSGIESSGSGHGDGLGVARIKEGDVGVSPQGAVDGGRLWLGCVTEAARERRRTALRWDLWPQ